MIVYNGPIGEPVVNPTDDFLKDIFFNQGEEYWKKGSGDSGIEVDGCDERIIFFYDNPYGFFVMRHPDYLVMYDESIDIKTVEHRVGGEPMQVPTCSYVTRKMAYKVISSFIKQKQISDFVSWIDLYDIDFDYEFQLYDKINRLCSIKLEMSYGMAEAKAKKSVEMKFKAGVPGITESKVGGMPFIPAGGAYPVDEKNSKKLYLLIQINFAEISRLPDFPESGILQIYIADDDMYGMDCIVGQVQDCHSGRLCFRCLATNYCRCEGLE